MIGLNGFAISDAMIWQLKYQHLVFLVLGWFIVFIHPKFFEYRQAIEGSAAWQTIGHHKPIIACSVIGLFILAVTKLAAASYSPFLYFQF